MKEMINMEKDMGISLSEPIRIVILQEIAKDLRTQEINKKPDSNLITDKQKNYLIAHGYTREAIDKMTRDEATKIIGELYKQ